MQHAHENGYEPGVEALIVELGVRNNAPETNFSSGMDPSGAPPPVPHTLRPHHVGILLMLIVYYRGVDYCQDGGTAHQLHPKVKMRMLRLLAREIGEVGARRNTSQMMYFTEMLWMRVDDATDTISHTRWKDCFWLRRSRP